MKQLNAFLYLLITSGITFAQSYPPGAEQEGTTAIHYESELFVDWAKSAEVERGFIDISNPQAHDQGSNYASYGQPENALGIADNNVVSLGDGGIAILTFEPPISNGPGFDFAVFENGLNDNFLELAFVEVSSDGENFFRFPSHSQTQTQTQVSAFGELDPTFLHNFAGKYRAFFGTPFDLEELDDHPQLNKNEITHVKIIDVVGSINPEFSSFDAYGNKVNDPFPTPFWSSGFDLDAVGVIHQQLLNVEEVHAQSIQIYPNPTSEFFFIGNRAKVTIKLFDGKGRVVLKTSSSNNDPIFISALEKGIYFMEIDDNGFKSLHRIIKK